MDDLRIWLTAHGGAFHPRVELRTTLAFGIAVFAPDIVVDTDIVTAPLSLAITKHTALDALKAILDDAPIDDWSERQLTAAYLVFHHVCTASSLRHLPYVQCLPPPDDLYTSLYFNTVEREILRGTNLYGATLDRERDWRTDWAQCRSLVQTVNAAWADAFTWERYRAASTHVSSRAFPSSILNPVPTLIATPSTYPVLIPGIDLLNHKRGQSVSWIVSQETHSITLVAHPQPRSDTEPVTQDLVQVFNNYGPKPNDELILGYGFSIRDNPDDAITLQIAGSPTAQKWVVGRHAQNVNGLWCDIQDRIVDGKSEYPFEDDLDTAATLSDMVHAKLDGMNTVADIQRHHDYVRPTVKVMLEHYIAGQREILESILQFANEKQQSAIETARAQGIDLVFGDDDDDV